MTLLRKFNTGVDIIKSDGLKGLFAALKRRIRGTVEVNPDEAKIAFEVLTVLTDKINPGIMVDVGAHYGTSLAPFAFSGWRIIAFEPDSQNRKNLKFRFKKYPNVIIDGHAVSDQTQSDATLYRSTESTGISGLSAFHKSHVASACVQVTTLEIGLQNHAVKNVDFLKIDTEGFDLFVLKGINWDIVSPKLILCEFEDSKTTPLGYTYHDLTKYLYNLGYKMIISEWYPIKNYGETHEWKRFAVYPSDLTDNQAWGNIIATQNETIFQALLLKCGL